MIVLLIANLVLTTIGLLYLAWSLQGVWDIIERRGLDKANTAVRGDRLAGVPCTGVVEQLNSKEETR